MKESFATLNAISNAGNIVNYTGFIRMTDTLPKVAKVGLAKRNRVCTIERSKVGISAA